MKAHTKEIQKTVCTLRWFDKKGEELVSECEMRGMNIEELHHLLNEPLGETLYGCYSINASQASLLQKFTSHPINLDVYDYFLENFKDA